MATIIPIKELKNTSQISDLCHKSDEPIFITKNGYGDMVLMSMDLYEETTKRYQMYDMIQKAEEQIDSGESNDARAVLSQIRRKHGI